MSAQDPPRESASPPCQAPPGYWEGEEPFWAEPGCLPGLSAEETAAQVAQMSACLQGPGQPPPDLAAVPGLCPGPGVTAQQIAHWERARGVRLPDVLRAALALQDGGYVRDTHIRVLPLGEIDIPDEEFWQWASIEKGDVPERKLLLRLGLDDEYSGSLFLNYNANGPQGEPGVFEHHHDPGDLRRRASSVTKFFGRLLETTEIPQVEWGETTTLQIVARETLDLSGLHGAPARMEQVLAQDNDALILFTHERTPAGETIAKTLLPRPLDARAAAIEPHRPAPVATHGLTLQPRKFDGIVATVSERTKTGRWKNSTTRGAPIAVLFEAPERARLEELRQTLFGPTAAGRARSKVQRAAKLQKKMAKLSPEERKAAAMEMFLQMMAKRGESGTPAPGEMPPEAAALNEALQEKMREAVRRAQEEVGKNPVDPEMRRLLEEMEEDSGQEG